MARRMRRKKMRTLSWPSWTYSSVSATAVPLILSFWRGKGGNGGRAVSALASWRAAAPHPAADMGGMGMGATLHKRMVITWACGQKGHRLLSRCERKAAAVVLRRREGEGEAERAGAMFQQQRRLVVVRARGGI